MDTSIARGVLKSGRSIIVPFVLPLRDNSDVLQCEKLLRVVPGRRVVLLCNWGGKQVIAKLFFQPLQVRRHIKRELSGIEALTKAGIATARLLYSGFAKDESTGVLLFEYIQPSVDIARLWGYEYSYENRIESLRQVVIALAGLHNKGLLQSDLHFKNFLLKDKNAYCIDGSTIKYVNKNGPANVSDSLQNLALLFCLLASLESDLVKDLFAVYSDARGWERAGADLDKLWRYIELRQKQRIRLKSKKIFRDTSEFICKKSFGCLFVCRRADYTEAMSAFLDDPDKMLNGRDAHLLKRGNTSTVARIKTDELDFVIKRYNIKNCLHGLRKSLMESRASKSWRNAHLLLISGILTPKPIAFLERRFGPFRGRAYFICEYAEGQRADSFFKDGDSNEKLPVAKQVTGIFKKLHFSMISHGDMKASNIIIHGRGPVLLDLDAMRIHSSQRGFASAHRKDISRFLRNWVDAPDVSKLFIKLIEGQRQ
ncbi:conserved hypothetical protein [uncultured Desulfobacterium sp.]|uniref:Protein kinase domain-containing protein n=1 Tax=uncultured Desulfobacterium sp. TaxID=201089 RepID=A0A445MRV7_9BACT|nr:conserved hypothetical protein [uncultured Desulfobacterium sp.]